MAKNKKKYKPTGGKQSTTCAFQRCRKTVRYDNKTFPYCYLHEHVKTARSSYVRSFSNMTQNEIENAREELYNPPMSLLSVSEDNVDSIGKEYGVDENKAKDIVNAYHMSIGDCDVKNPIEARQQRDNIIEKLYNNIPQKYKPEVLKCNSGITSIGNNRFENLDSHRVIRIQTDPDDPSYIIDPVALAPYAGSKKIMDEFNKTGRLPQTSNPIKSGSSFTPLFQYAEYRPVAFRDLVSEETGETIWVTKNMHGGVAESSDINAQRKLAQQYPQNLVFPDPDNKNNSGLSDAERIRQEEEQLDRELGF